ncbi:DUF4342 domain-containing protein [Clostridium bovifaecis]|uniref:DUF4342 domain-containing protein n=1 Tax=Clostridium bovifaecis TaxID=2184719 RepID=A0A6I6F7A8_9CLOT|nr:DUF4342 domain-containing protein [Clostridium bovifaecis]
MSTKLEQVDLLRERTGVSYNEAKEALEKCDYDLVEAIVYLEKAHNLKTTKKISCNNFTEKCKDIIDKGNKTRFIVKKKDNVVVNIPVTIAGITTIVAFPLAITGMLLALVTNHRIKLEKSSGEDLEVNTVFDKMSTAVNNVTNNLSKPN